MPTTDRLSDDNQVGITQFSYYNPPGNFEESEETHLSLTPFPKLLLMVWWHDLRQRFSSDTIDTETIDEQIAAWKNKKAGLAGLNGDKGTETSTTQIPQLDYLDLCGFYWIETQKAREKETQSIEVLLNDNETDQLEIHKKIKKALLKRTLDGVFTGSVASTLLCFMLFAGFLFAHLSHIAPLAYTGLALFAFSVTLGTVSPFLVKYSITTNHQSQRQDDDNHDASLAEFTENGF